MQNEGTPQYLRVKAVADMFDVSAATIYRAIEAGELDAIRVGKSLRVPESALAGYVDRCAQDVYESAVVAGVPLAETDSAAAATVADGRACVVCRVDFVRSGVSHVPVGRSESGSQVFACVGVCAQHAEQTGAVA